MDINIAKTTDKEIQEIIQKLKSKGHYQEDEMCLRIETPFEVKPDSKEGRRNRIFFVLYPELLSYSDRDDNRKVEWVTIPWICCKVDLLAHHLVDEKLQRDLGKWLVEHMKEVGYKPFHDEDAFGGYFSRDVRDDRTTLKMYINPSFPEGCWSNHTL